MTKGEVKELLRSISGTWKSFKIQNKEELEATVEGWSVVLRNVSIHEVLAALERYYNTDKARSYAPTAPELLQEAKKVIAPKLALTYADAKAQNTKLYRKAFRSVHAQSKGYNPLNAPDEMISANDIKFGDKRVEETYYSLVNKYLSRPYPELLTLVERAQQRLENKPQTLQLVKQTALGLDGKVAAGGQNNPQEGT